MIAALTVANDLKKEEEDTTPYRKFSAPQIK